MTLDKDNLLSSILESLDRIHHIKLEDIPNIELYMDQVTTFMEHNLKSSLRNPEDKILTKTMINNYAKNDLLPPPVKKKYSREHIIMLIFIYYLKNILSINDIQTVLNPITDKYFGNKDGYNMEDIYKEIFDMEKEESTKVLKEFTKKYQIAKNTFKEYPEEDQELLQTFSFICLLSFDIYIKKQAN